MGGGAGETKWQDLEWEELGQSKYLLASPREMVQETVW